MREKSYIKNKCEQAISDTFEDENVKKCSFQFSVRKCMILSILVITLFSVSIFYIKNSLNDIKISEIVTDTVSMPLTSVLPQKSVIEIPSRVVKMNPFLPYRDINGIETLSDEFDSYLVEPPLVSGEKSEAARVMDTMVSGILYDKFSPSAILNIEGNDYLVKKGDVINNYKVINIVRDSVTVSLGSNVYKAGIGEILTEGTLNHNNVSNLENKFGGENNEL